MTTVRERIAAVVTKILYHDPKTSEVERTLDALEAIVREEVRTALNEAAGLAKDEADKWVYGPEKDVAIQLKGDIRKLAAKYGPGGKGR